MVDGNELTFKLKSKSFDKLIIVFAAISLPLLIILFSLSGEEPFKGFIYFTFFLAPIILYFFFLNKQITSIEFYEDYLLLGWRHIGLKKQYKIKYNEIKKVTYRSFYNTKEAILLETTIKPSQFKINFFDTTRYGVSPTYEVIVNKLDIDFPSELFRRPKHKDLPIKILEVFNHFKVDTETID